MPYTFDEIMAYHPDNKTIYEELKQLFPILTPFVGAGLTQFAYYSWPDALRELSKKQTNRRNQQNVNRLIRRGDYLNAAQELERMRTQTNLAHDLAKLFSADRLEEKRGELYRESITLLPKLFPGLVLTTNFDETLETVYRESGQPFQAVLYPGHAELLRQFAHEGGCGLFKLHGTVTGRHIEYGRIVFTQTQYDTVYGKGSPLRNDLKYCFEQRILFFLGCSLENDRTVNLLQETVRPGESHYTIIGCEKSKRDEKVQRLGEKHIRAILYEQGRHEAVRVILERLLEDTAPAHHLPVPPPALSVPVNRAAENQPEYVQTLSDLFKKRLTLTLRNSGDYHLEKITAQLYPALKDSIYETSFHAENTDTDTSLWHCLKKDWQEPSRSHYMLVGVGGCGKTVAMQQTARLLLDHNIFAIYIPMHELKHEKQSIEKYIRQYILYRDDVLWRTLYRSCREGMTGGSPSLVLFLDGWNEVREEKVGQAWFSDILQEELALMWMGLPGVQIIMAGRERADKNIGWNNLLTYLEVMPLQRRQIESYLNTCGVSLPGEKDSIWKTISNPLMLVLYVNTVGQRGQFERLPGITFISNEKHSSQSAVIWNFLQCQVGKFVCLNAGNSYSYFIAINYAASWIGWNMEQRQQYQLTRGEMTDLLDKAGENYSLWWSGSTYLTNIRQCLSSVDWQWDTEELRHILCDETSLLYCGTPEEERDAAANEIFQFIHQKFRDCYAAIYMRSQLSPYGAEEVPEFCHSWQSFAANAEILDMLDPFFSLRKLDELWLHQRGKDADDNSFAMFHLLELYQREGQDISLLDFSGQDLRFVSLQNRNLYTDGICFRGAKVSNRTLLPQNHASTIGCLAWLPAANHNGSDYFLSAGRDLRLWNIRTGELQNSCQDHDSGITCVAVSWDGSKFATTSHDKKMMIYLTGQPDAPHRCYVADRALTAAAFSPTGSHLAVGDEDGKIILCTVEGVYLKDVSSCGIKPEKNVKTLCFDDGGRYLSALTADNILALWEITQNFDTLLLWSQKITDKVLDINFDEHGKALLFVLATGEAFRLASDTCNLVRLWKLDAVSWDSAVFSRDNKHLAAYWKNELKLLYTFNGHEYKTLLFPTDKSDAFTDLLAFSPDGRKILYGSDKCSLFVWNAEPPISEAEHAEPPFCIIKNSYQGLSDFALFTENILICAFGDGYLTWWNIKLRQCFRCEKLLDVTISHMVLSPDKKRLVTVGRDNVLLFWNMETLRQYPLKVQVAPGVQALNFSPDGTIFCCACDDSHVYGWNMQDFVPLFSIALENGIRITSMIFLSDGSLLGGSSSGKIYRWKMPEGIELEWPVLHNDLVSALAVSADGRLMISLSHDGFLLYWHPEHSCCFNHWKLDSDSVLWNLAILSDDGRYVLAGKVCPDRKNELYFWEISAHENKIEIVREKRIPLSSISVNQALFFASDSKVLYNISEGSLYISDTNQLVIGEPLRLLPNIHLINADFRGAYFEDQELMELVRMSGGKTDNAYIY